MAQFNVHISVTATTAGNIRSDGTRAVENQPSETAHAVALCRALASRDTRFGVQISDPFSELFLKENVIPVLLEETARRSAIDKMIPRPLYGYFLASPCYSALAWKHQTTIKTCDIVIAVVENR